MVSRRVWWLALMALPMPGQKPVSDGLLHDQVRIRLTADIDVKGASLAIDVRNGVVTLRGKVETDKARQKAEKLAKKVKGVKQVVNELKVDKATGGR